MKEKNIIKSYFKKFLTIVLAVALVVSLGTPAMEVHAGNDTTVIRSNGRTFYLKTYRKKDYSCLLYTSALHWKCILIPMRQMQQRLPQAIQLLL